MATSRYGLASWLVVTAPSCVRCPTFYSTVSQTYFNNLINICPFAIQMDAKQSTSGQKSRGRLEGMWVYLWLKSPDSSLEWGDGDKTPHSWLPPSEAWLGVLLLLPYLSLGSPLPWGHQSLDEGFKGLRRWQTRAQIPTKQCSCRQTLRDLLDFILLGGHTWQVLPIQRFFGGIPVLGTVLCTSHTDIQSTSCTARNSSFHKQKQRKFEDFHFQIQETWKRGINNHLDVALYTYYSIFLVFHSTSLFLLTFPIPYWINKLVFRSNWALFFWHIWKPNFSPIFHALSHLLVSFYCIKKKKALNLLGLVNECC